MLLDEVEGKYLSAVSGATATLGYIHEDSLVWVVYREVRNTGDASFAVVNETGR